MYEHALVMRTAVLGSDGPKETFACIKNGIGRPEKRICTPLPPVENRSEYTYIHVSVSFSRWSNFT